MKTEKDIRFMRSICLDLATRENGVPELVRRYKFAVNAYDYVLEQDATFNKPEDFEMIVDVGGDKT
jgi:hypothetical protein